MRKLLIGILFSLIIPPQLVMAGLNDFEKAQVSSYNSIRNPGFESSSSDWAYPGTTPTVNTSSPMFGLADLQWDSSSSGQVLQSQAVNVPPGLYGANADGYCYMKTPSGTATHTFQVVDGSGNLLSSSVTVPSSTSASKVQVPSFVAPSSGTWSVKFISVASNEPSITVDNCYLGPAIGVGSIAQSRFVGGLENAGASSCVYSENSSTGFSDFKDLGTGSSCAAWTATSNGPGTISAQGTNDHRLVYTNMPAGNFTIEFQGAVQKGSTAGSCIWRLSDGTTTYQPQLVGLGTATGVLGTTTLRYHVPYTTAGTRTFKLQAADDFAADVCQINNSANIPASWKIYYFPTNDQAVYTTDQSDYNWTAYTPTLGAGFGTPSNVSFFHKRIGDTLYVRGTFTVGTRAASPTTISLPGSLALDTTKLSINNTSANPGEMVGRYDNSEALANTEGAVVTAPSTTTTAVYLGQSEVNAASSLTPGDGTQVTASSVVLSVFFAVPISGWTGMNRAPQLVNSYLTEYSGLWKTIKANINCDASSAITSQSGGLSSVGNRSTTSCALTINSGVFAATPYACNVTINATTVNATACACSSATACTIYGPNADYDAFVTIEGPK